MPTRLALDLSSDEAYTARRRELADSYLDHMLLILECNDRGSNPRNFLDPWWSFTKGDPFIKGRKKGNLSQHTLNNPCAKGCDTAGQNDSRLNHLDWISEGARSALKRSVCTCNERRRTRVDARSRQDILIVEHAVPFANIVEIIFEEPDSWSRDNLRSFLAHHFKRALLTREEDDMLNETRDGRSLRANMPTDWRVGDDPYARYHARSIAGSPPQAS